MDWCFLILGSVCFVEIFIRLQAIAHIKRLNDIVSRIIRVIRSANISDHWKEKILPQYALQLFKQSLLIFGALIASFGVFPISGAISYLLGNDFLALSTSTTGLAVSTCTALLYAVVRARSSQNTGGYTAASKALHHIALGAPFIGDALFDIEKSVYASKTTDITNENHVFVCGLARAGTTILMRRLHESGRFVSLTYRDMPFVLAPNLWRKMRGGSAAKMKSQERAHGDGLMVDYDSPEALEEVFWKNASGDAYIQASSLVPMAAADEVIEDFRQYIALILHESGISRYLSKNNNNMVRLPAVARAFPNAVILVPFRRPEHQAFSLLKQHQRFMQMHQDDPFSRKYMTWLVHHEFGTDHRPFQFGEQKQRYTDTDSPDYWLEVWLNTYSYVIDNPVDQSRLVCYEALCEDSEQVWDSLTQVVNLPANSDNLKFSGSYHTIDYLFDADLLNRAHALYDRMREQSVGYRNY